MNSQIKTRAIIKLVSTMRTRSHLNAPTDAARSRHREEDYDPATAGAVACVRNSCSRISMAAIPRSERTTRPRVTNLRAHLSFNFTGQFIESSTRDPGTMMPSTAKSTPELDILTVLPAPGSVTLRLFKMRYRISRTIGKRSEWRRSACAFSFINVLSLEWDKQQFSA